VTRTVKHAIVLASEEWCEVASKGEVRIYDFIKPRKKGIHALGPGSICVVLTRAEKGKPSRFYGEFTVVEVKEISADEYNSLANKGLIRNPITLKSGEKIWIILFDEFKEYEYKIPRKDLHDVKTATSKRPIRDWAITGLSYIDDNALRAIREKAGISVRPEETHECIELKLIELGSALGFKTYTADITKKCGEVELGRLINLTQRDLPMADKLKTIDVIWYKHPNYKLFEVVLTSDVRTSLLKFAEVAELNADYFIVARSQDIDRFNKAIGLSTFSKIKSRTKFINLEVLNNIYEITMKWRKSIDILNLPYLSP